MQQIISGKSKDLMEMGIIIDIQVVYNKNKSKHIKALIDTGASSSGIELDTLADIEAKPSGDVRKIRTPNGEFETNDYANIEIIFRDDSDKFVKCLNGIFSGIKPNGSRAYQAILGRDFLSLVKLNYEGTENKWSISFLEDK